ncbi:hypothetical protein AB0M39_02660 [Streptomyces sp. NPDC051907]|uniref:hypothetical protein n=1 Tax=Streptomyces sp. NPDC051907 TaxID=3155284 RepID=UPI0034353B99
MTRHPERAPETAATTGTEITSTDCQQCGTQVYGIDGRYACPSCGWVNHWSEGHNWLPTESEAAQPAERA